MKRKAYDGVYNRYIKRGIDFCLALIGLVIAAIPMAIVAIAIKAESKGPVIFKQDRIGYKGKVYKMYKFRSMCVGAEKGGVYSDNKDSRVTKVGKFIRAISPFKTSTACECFERRYGADRFPQSAYISPVAME